MSLGRSLDTEQTHESECKSCKAVIVWAVSEKSGKRLPLDRAPDVDGRFVIESWQATEYGMAPVVRHLRPHDLESDVGAHYTSHFATCPDAAEHRRR